MGSADNLTAERPSPGPGRPRNEELDELILETVRELVVEMGYQALSVQEVVRQCNVHVRTITRRWPSKAELVTAAISGGDEEPSPALGATGNLRADLRSVVEGALDYMSQPATRVAMPALMAEMRTNAHVAARFHRRQADLRATVHTILEAAVQSGDAPKTVIRARRLLPNMITGSAFSVQFMDADPPKDPLIDELTDLLLAAALGA